MKDKLQQLSDRCTGRLDFWARFCNEYQVAAVAEVGVFKGRFAEALLQQCPAITDYYLIDPWRNLPEWNKPANVHDDRFERFYNEAMDRTAFAAGKRHVLRGKTTEVIDSIGDESLDFTYIDGDHTLKGITIDLVNCWPKVKAGGFIGGDDFSPTIWQHDQRYEPTLVFPFAIYFAEAVGAPIYGLGDNQFLIEKSSKGFSFQDLSGQAAYANPSLSAQLGRGGNGKTSSLKSRLINRMPFLARVYKKLK